MTIGRIPSVEGGIQPTIVDAKGDLIAATAADTVNRLAVGSDYGFLQALASETTGLKWNDDAWTSYTPTVSSSTGTITTASATGKWKRVGKLIAVQQTITITTNGTGAGNLRATLPFDAESTDFIGSGRENAVTGNMLQLQTSGNLVIYRTTANAYPGGDGRSILGTIVYEVD
jgi:pectate lyase